MSKLLIKCPHCGTEYTPSEIFYSDDLLGNQSNIVRDANGKIESSSGEPPTLEQEFECYSCNHVFKVHVNMTFTTTTCEEHDFDSDYTVKIKK